MISGRVWKYGDHVNTDLIIPGRYLDNYDPKHLAAHAMEDLDPLFAKGVQMGDIILPAVTSAAALTRAGPDSPAVRGGRRHRR